MNYTYLTHLLGKFHWPGIHREGSRQGGEDWHVIISIKDILKNTGRSHTASRAVYLPRNATQRESHEMSTSSGKESTFSAARVNILSTEIKENLLITD